MSCKQQKSGPDSLEYYFPHLIPVTNPILFCPEILGEENNVRDITFSIDYKEFYYTQITNDTFIMTSKYQSGAWTKPSIAAFSGTSSDFEPCITPDGKSLFFTSKRSSAGKPWMKNDFDIWKVHRTDSGWSNPELLDKSINTNCMEYYPSVSKNGTLYFGRNDSALTRGDIHFSVSKNNTYTMAQKLPESINLPTTSFNAYISGDEDYIIFSSYVFENDSWHSDLFISYFNLNGEWDTPLRLGDKINSSGNEFSPWISYDEKYLFYASTRLDTSGLNNRQNIFWVRTSTIENFN